MNPKKALKKGLASITEDEFINAVKSYTKEGRKTNGNEDDIKHLKEKYPFYRQLMKMAAMAARDEDKVLIAHFSGMASAYNILLHIAENNELKS